MTDGSRHGSRVPLVHSALLSPLRSCRDEQLTPQRTQTDGDDRAVVFNDGAFVYVRCRSHARRVGDGRDARVESSADAA